jgi:hypothetical protein
MILFIILVSFTSVVFLKTAASEPPSIYILFHVERTFEEF